jgi:hypothetical protein
MCVLHFVQVQQFLNEGKEIMSVSTKQQRDFGTNSVDNSEVEEHSEGTIARTLEQQTAKLPSDVFLWAAVGSIGASALLQIMGKKKASLFVGEWVSPFLLFGVYNKIVKVAGSDRAH